jgi:hypothetical protein
MKWLYYFRSPFPSRQGFSAYRFPGLLVHLPLIVTSALTGLLLCGPHAPLRPLIVLWLVAGVYLGRDFTILCHYAPPLIILGWGAAFATLVKGPWLQQFGRQHSAVVLGATLALGALLGWAAHRATRD